MVAAVYCRKSTDQSGVADDQKSVARQLDHARAYASAKGWTIDERFIYVDDGVSGAEFANRPGFLRLMNALKPQAPFEVLIVSELSRLGREQFETGYALKQLSQAGVTVYSYLEVRPIALDSPVDKFLLSAVNFAAEVERDKARQRVTDAMVRKARAGYVTGGRCFGYDNLAITSPDGRRSHVERRINTSEAEIVRAIFQRCAAGQGVKAIAKALNAAAAATPQPVRGRPAGWAPSSVRSILYRRTYLGEIRYGMTRKHDTWGRRRTQKRPDAEVLVVDQPVWRIVSQAEWDAAHARFAATAAAVGIAAPGSSCRPRLGVVSKYLLSGLARCATCGGSLIAHVTSERSRRSRTTSARPSAIAAEPSAPTVSLSRWLMPTPPSSIDSSRFWLRRPSSTPQSPPSSPSGRRRCFRSSRSAGESVTRSARYDAIMPRSLTAFCRRFGIDVPDPLTGADIALAVKEARWGDVEAHQRADVTTTALLAERLGCFRRSSAA